ncbi:MAG: hypothetical protein QG671_2901 [Actinomycetota bacterium]|nr:hypothetical protein [Actinomycetota bacterium]
MRTDRSVSGEYRLQFTPTARKTLEHLSSQPQYEKQLRQVRRALGRLQGDPRHPGLHSHEHSSLHGANGEDVWDSSSENHVPAAWRPFWHYGPTENVITILMITPRP